MSAENPPQAPRKPRADAQRNRERILKMARLAFTRDGAEATLDDIAREAGVGAGTLYRHFPTRDDLIEAVYRGEVEKLTAAAVRFAAALPPLDALRAWMLLFVDHVAEKKLILPAMETVAGGSMRLIEGARGHVQEMFFALVRGAMESGDLRADIEPGDFVRGMVGVFHTTSQPGWEPSARRIVDILIAGSRANRVTPDCRACPGRDDESCERLVPVAAHYFQHFAGERGGTDRVLSVGDLIAKLLSAVEAHRLGLDVQLTDLFNHLPPGRLPTLQRGWVNGRHGLPESTRWQGEDAVEVCHESSYRHAAAEHEPGRRSCGKQDTAGLRPSRVRPSPCPEIGRHLLPSLRACAESLRYGSARRGIPPRRG